MPSALICGSETLRTATQCGSSAISLLTRPSTASPISDTDPQASAASVVIVRSIEPKEVRCQDGLRPGPSLATTIFGGRVLSGGSCPELALNSPFALAKYFVLRRAVR